jgi:hypothetical protein
MVKTHSEPTSFRKGHRSRLREPTSLIPGVAVKAAGCIVYQRRELALRISKKDPLQGQIRAHSPGASEAGE